MDHFNKNFIVAVKHLGKFQFVQPRRFPTAGEHDLSTFWKFSITMWSSQDHWPIFFCDFILFRTLLVAPSPAVTRLAVDPRAGRLFVAAHTRTRTSQPKVIYIPIFPFSSWGWSFLNLLHSNTHCIGLYRAQFTFTPWVECRWICWMPRLGLSLVSPWIQSNRYSSSSSVLD